MRRERYSGAGFLETGWRKKVIRRWEDGLLRPADIGNRRNRCRELDFGCKMQRDGSVD